jgi:sarcosine oxidase gamma subunit
MPASASPDARWCSAACRKHGIDDTDRALEQRIDELLAARARTASICPSEVARSVAPDDWRPLMEPARRAARRMVARGEVEITQHGSVVDPSTAKGPIRIRRPR